MLGAISLSAPAATAAVTANQSLTLTKFTVFQCYSILHCFGLDASVYQVLMQRYSQTALSFPIQTLSFQPMNGSLYQKTNVSLTLTTTPRFVDSIFIIFPLTNDYKTVFFNPIFDEWTLKMGGYGQIPDVGTTTYSPRFYELCTNALNMNNDSQGFNEEVMRSIVLPPSYPPVVVTAGNKSNDITNFFIGIPVETDHTFQQGQTSNSSITYYLQGSQSVNSAYYQFMTASPLMGFLKDSVLAIQLREGSTPIISIDEYDISSPAS
jgi:hypothetical protein